MDTPSPPRQSVTWGLGAASLGNLGHEVTDQDAAAIVAQMWDAGVRTFDTAPHYGLGLSERRVGAALAALPRGELMLSTKVGRLLEPDPAGDERADDEGFVVRSRLRRRWDFSAAGVRASLSASLDRLGMDRVDTLYVHDPEGHLDQAVDEALPALVALREEGMVGRIGVGSKDVGALTRIIETGLIDVAMVAGRFTLLEQPAARRVLPAARRHGVDIVAVGVYNSGILATETPDPQGWYEYGRVPRAVYERAVLLADVCRSHGVSLPTAALHFPFLSPQVSTVMVGIGRPAHVADTVARMSAVVPDALWADLRERGLIEEVVGE